MEKSCAKCGHAFFCGSPASVCWCNDVLLDRSLGLARENFHDCLCPTCLAEYQIAGNEDNPD